MKQYQILMALKKQTFRYLLATFFLLAIALFPRRAESCQPNDAFSLDDGGSCNALDSNHAYGDTISNITGWLIVNAEPDAPNWRNQWERIVGLDICSHSGGQIYSKIRIWWESGASQFHSPYISSDLGEWDNTGCTWTNNVIHEEIVKIRYFEDNSVDCTWRFYFEGFSGRMYGGTKNNENFANNQWYTHSLTTPFVGIYETWWALSYDRPQTNWWAPCNDNNGDPILPGCWDGEWWRDDLVYLSIKEAECDNEDTELWNCQHSWAIYPDPNGILDTRRNCPTNKVYVPIQPEITIYTWGPAWNQTLTGWKSTAEYVWGNRCDKELETPNHVWEFTMTWTTAGGFQLPVWDEIPFNHEQGRQPYWTQWESFSEADIGDYKMIYTGKLISWESDFLKGGLYNYTEQTYEHPHRTIVHIRRGNQCARTDKDSWFFTGQLDDSTWFPKDPIPPDSNLIPNTVWTDFGRICDMEVIFNGIGTNGNYERPVHLTYCFYPKKKQQLWGFSIRWSVTGEVGYWPLSDETVPLDLATDLPTGVECWYHTIGEEEIIGMVMTGSKNLERLALVTHWENVYGDPTIGKTTRFYPFTGPWYGFEYVWQKDADFPDGRSVDLRPIVTHCPCEIDKLYLSQKHNDTANFTLDIDEGITKSAKLFFAVNAVVELFFESKFECENDHIYVYGLTSIEPTPFTSTFFKVDDGKRKYYLQTIDPRDYLAGPYYEIVMQATMTADDLFMNNQVVYKTIYVTITNVCAAWTISFKNQEDLFLKIGDDPVDVTMEYEFGPPECAALLTPAMTVTYMQFAHFDKSTLTFTYYTKDPFHAGNNFGLGYEQQIRSKVCSKMGTCIEAFRSFLIWWSYDPKIPQLNNMQPFIRDKPEQPVDEDIVARVGYNKNYTFYGRDLNMEIISWEFEVPKELEGVVKLTGDMTEMNLIEFNLTVVPRVSTQPGIYHVKLKLLDTAQTYVERVFKITIDDPSDIAELWIVDCNQIGEVFFQASQPLAIPQNWTNTTNKEEDWPVLKLRLDSLVEINKPQLVNWTIEFFNSSLIKMVINYDDYHKVSSQTTQDDDQLADVLNFHMLNYFFAIRNRTSSGRRLGTDVTQFGHIDESDYIDLSCKLPKQLSAAEFKVLDGLGDVASNGFSIMVLLPFALQIGLKGAMKRIWAFFMMLQLLLTFPKLKLNYPPNIMLIQNKILDILNFQPIKKETIYNWFVSDVYGKENTTLAVNNTLDVNKTLTVNNTLLNSTVIVNSTYANTTEQATTGLISISSEQKENILMNLSFLFGVTVLFGVIILVGFLIYKYCFRRSPKFIQNQMTMLKHALLFNQVLRTFLMMYLDTAVKTSIALGACKWAGGKSIANGLISLLLLIGLTLFSFWVRYFLLKSQHRLAEEGFQKSFIAIYTNLEYYGKPQSLLYTGYMLQRRMVLALTIGLLAYDTTIQMFVTINAAVLICCYVLVVGPMIEDIEDYLSTHNECMVLFFATYIMLFSGYVSDPASVSLFGEIYLYILGWALLVNICVACFLGWKQLQLYLRRRKAAHYQKLLRQKKEQEQRVTGMWNERAKRPQPSQSSVVGRQSLFFKTPDQVEAYLAAEEALYDSQQVDAPNKVNYANGPNQANEEGAGTNRHEGVVKAIFKQQTDVPGNGAVKLDDDRFPLVPPSQILPAKGQDDGWIPFTDEQNMAMNAFRRRNQVPELVVPDYINFGANHNVQSRNLGNTNNFQRRPVKLDQWPSLAPVQPANNFVIDAESSGNVSVRASFGNNPPPPRRVRNQDQDYENHLKYEADAWDKMLLDEARLK